MKVITYEERVSTRGDGDTRDLTGEIGCRVRESGVTEGTATVFVPGSTAGITTIEHEPGVVRDLKDCLERLAPRDIPYAHEEAWHDGNGHSHVRAALLGPSVVVPIREGRLALGTWQQVVLVDFDNRPRTRTWTVTVMGV